MALTGTARVVDVDALRRRDGEAFAHLHRAQHGPLSAVARRYLSREEDVEDAVQEAFLSAFRAIDRFDGRAAIGTWLHAITVNAARMRLRSQRRHPHMLSVDAIVGDGESAPRATVDERTAARPAEASATEEERSMVQAMIPRLPERYREVISMRDLEGLDTQATAELLGTTSNAVKVRLYRARRALRLLLEERGLVA